MSSMKYYLGVDGGGTKTKFTLCRCDKHSATPYGEIVGEYISTCCHYLQIGFDGLERLMTDGIQKTCEQARSNPNAGASDFQPADISCAFFGLAGYGDIASDDPKIKNAIQRALGSLTYESSKAIPFGIGNDGENALAGALGGKPGINIIAGTGSVGCGRDHQGNHARCGGWNYALGGDEGSAFWIARNLLHEFQRQSDGRDEKTLLHKTLTDTLQLPSDDALTTRVVQEWGLDRTRIAKLSPIAATLVAAGDPYAKAIIRAAAAELADYAIALKKQLHFEGDVPVSGTGGVFHIGSLLTDEFDRIIKEHGMHYVKPLYEPDIGAVLLAISI